MKRVLRNKVTLVPQPEPSSNDARPPNLLWLQNFRARKPICLKLHVNAFAAQHHRLRGWLPEIVRFGKAPSIQ